MEMDSIYVMSVAVSAVKHESIIIFSPRFELNNNLEKMGLPPLTKSRAVFAPPYLLRNL